MKKLNIKKGDKFGLLSILKEIEQKSNKRRFLCKCDCGNIVEVFLLNLRTQNHTQSCGCYHKSVVTKHKKSNTRLYSTYASMKERCYNSNNKRFSTYGGRGIFVCRRWRKSFGNFYKDMGDRPKSKTLDRIDNNGPYAPWNCRWATDEEQYENKRKRIRILYNGERLLLKDLSNELGIKESTLMCRYIRGWTDKEIVETPLNKRRNYNATV